MADKFLGKWLYDAGWRQGSLLPALPWSVVYDLNDPLTKIAKSTKRQLNHKSETITTEIASPSHGVASGITHITDYLVIITQDCDIVKDPNQIPTIFAMRAFITEKEQILRAAISNSARYFLLDEDRGLVADSTIIVPIEKPVLATLTSQPGVTNDGNKRQFARWVAHCFNRPAFPDEVVRAVVAPILHNLRLMQNNSDPALDVLNLVREVRVAPLIGNPPYKVNLLFITSEEGFPDNGIELARFVKLMHEWFDPTLANLDAWDAAHLYEITAGDYIDTQQIYLDHYTYEGSTIIGLTPPFYPL